MTFIVLNAYAIVATILLTVYGIFSFKKGKGGGRLLAGAFWLCASLFAVLLISLYLSSDYLKKICYSFVLAYQSWILYFVLLSVRDFCSYSKKRTYIIALRILLIINTAVLITNPINHFGVDFSKYDFHGVDLLKPIIDPFYLCVGITFFLLIGSIFVVIFHKVMQLSAYYRTRYYPILAGAVALVIAGAISLRTASGFADPSIFLMTVGLFLLYFVLYNFSNNTLLGKLQPYINDCMADASVIYDNTGEILAINKRACEIFDENIRKNASMLKDFLDYPDANREKKCELNGYTYSVLYKPVFDKKNNLVADIFVLHDVTEMERRIEQEHKIAITDALTGAHNRKGFFELANDFLYRNESEAGFALVISGVLDFKSINSSYGSKVGDTVLKAIERKFHDYHHSYPMIYGRTAEGKFTALIPFDYVDELAADMSLVNIPIGNESAISVELCHGFIVLDDISKPLDYYYERALIALSECKKNATIGVLEYSYSMEEKIARQQVLISEMHNAINDEQFFIELQPQINLSNRKVCGAEALVRWNHPKLGRISPAEFIPLFEDNGFISNLDVYVWEKAAKTLKMLEEEGVYDGSVSVNVSQIDIKSMDVATVLERIVDETHVDREKFHVEITESACADKRESLIYTMERLRERGFILEIDDFGSGYSSLNALMHLPFDVVKLDMEFMKENNLEGKNGVIMNSIAYMIHNIGASIIVEGVETERNVENMVNFGGDIAQGYYFSRPLSVEAFKEYAKKR